MSEVIVDTLTGEFKLLRADLLHDAGTSINPAIDIGQVEGGFIQGMGWLTTEELWWDEEGALMTHAPSTYKIPAVNDCPADFRAQLFANRNVEDTVLRSKAVGEPPLLLAFSVFFAIRDAIASVGGYRVNPPLDAPATGEAILRAVDAVRTDGEPPRSLCAAAPHPAPRDQPSAVLRPSASCSLPAEGSTAPFGRPSGRRASRAAAMTDWIDVLAAHCAKGAPAVLVTVVAAKGSAPRPPGTRMVVAAERIDGTIGGGHLEWKAIDLARGLLGSDGGSALHRFPLGASLGQCCGGAVQLLFEPVRGNPSWLAALAQARGDGEDCALITAVRGGADGGRLVVAATRVSGTLGAPSRDERAVALARSALALREAPRLVRLDGAAAGERVEHFIDVVRQPDFRIVLFGAGHVGRALVGVLAALPCRITWVDTRDDAFPSAVPAGVRCIGTDAPEAEVAAAPAGAYYLVMTHSHALDEQLAEAILGRADRAYFGLIGSVSKRRQFERRLEARGVARADLAAMRCPIGIAGIAGKEPEVIAIAVAAELLQVRSGAAAAHIVPHAQPAAHRGAR